MESYDIAVIGGGPGGYVCAIKLAQLGFKVACIDKRKSLGGTCLNVGCIPSKALLDMSESFVKSNAMISSRLVKGKRLDPDLSEMMKKKASSVEGLTKGIEGLFKKNGVAFICGSASFINSESVEVKGDKSTQISAKNFIIATGSEPSSLPSITIDEKNIVSSTGALEFSSIPKKLVVVGSGVIGLELGSVYSRLGTEVTFIEFSSRIAATALDTDVSKNLQKILEKQGMSFLLNTKVTSVKSGPTGVVVSMESLDGENSKSLNADKVLVSIGRRPYTDNLNLSAAGVSTDDRGFILTNKKLQTSTPNIYAIGDVTHGPMLAHKAEEEGVAVAENLAGQHGHVNHNLIPSVIYTHPEVASVGKTEDELKGEGIECNVGKFSMLANSRARAVDDSEGFVKILACKKTDLVLGCHIISPHAGEIIHEAVLAMEFSASSEDIARTCHAHPTFSEAVKEAALATFSKPIHS